MIGLLIQLLISWLLVWWLERKNLSVLGLAPTTHRLGAFVFYLVLTAFCCASGFLLRIYFGHESWELNPKLSAVLVGEGIWWNLKSVLFEELIFRGVVLYLLVQRLGTGKAILLSSIAFGIYHWFSQGAWGNPQQMVITFVLTGIMGLIYAYGYSTYQSLYVPIAIHFGWNFTQSFVFSSGSIGKGVLILKNQPQVQVSLFVYWLIVLLPILSAWLLNFFFLKRQAKMNAPLHIKS